MTRNNILKKTRSKLIAALLVICILCMSLFAFSACSPAKEESSNSNTSYTYSEVNDTPISNSYFAYGTADVKLTSYPKSSVTGWTKSAETNMSSSSSKYGVIDVSEDGWDALLDNLYNDSYFLNYFKIRYDFEESDVKEALSEDTSSNIKNYIIDNYFKSDKEFKYPEGTTDKNQFSNPGVHDGAKDTKVYMLNNYLSKDNVGRGTAQKVTSATTITLNKGEYGKVSVWVKTQNLSGIGETFGANIRLTNAFNSASQASFGIYNIVDTEWTQYTIYVKADETYSTTFSLILGLGSDLLTATEGTAYFDDVEFEHVTAEEYKANAAIVRGMNYDSEEAIKINASELPTTNKSVLYDMSLNGYLTANAPTYKLPIADLNEVDVNYTVSNKEINGNKINGGRFDDVNTSPVKSIITLDETSFPYAEKALKVSLNKASYTLSLFKDNPIEVEPEQYSYVEFYVKNELHDFGSTNVTVDAFDICGSQVKKRAAVATISKVDDEWTKVGVVIKNNFTEGTRSFYLDIILGPTDVAATDYAMDYATGDVTITTPTISSGSTNQYVDDSEMIETDNYALYSLFNSSSNGTISLYAGSANDYSEEDEATENYDISVAPSDIGSITTKPATPKGYKGIVPDHFYITDKQDAVTAINTNTKSGVINTKYLDAYGTQKYGDVKAKLEGAYDEDIQPLMIYNDTASSYGYIGDSQSIAASSFAKFEVALRVTDAAKAFIYLVNTNGTTKEVLTFEDFNVNADQLGNTVEGKSYEGENMKLYFNVTSDMMNEDGWVTVEFYVATGASAKNVRIEIWNGSRDGSISSTGHVFIKSIHAHTSNAFTEGSDSKTVWTTAGNPLYEAGESSFKAENLLIFKRQLTDTEKKFNAEQTDASKKVSYPAKYVWAQNETMIYAIYNSIDAVEVDPYANQETEEEESSGCAAEADPSTFWLSFSSILLGVALVAAIIMLVVKNTLRRRKRNASDAKSHYKVTSRTKSSKTTENKADDNANKEVDEEDTTVEEVEEEPEETSDEEEKKQNLDEYVYGDVQDFGEENSSEEKSEESTDSENK